jgi:hypothetical protein
MFVGDTFDQPPTESSSMPRSSSRRAGEYVPAALQAWTRAARLCSGAST